MKIKHLRIFTFPLFLFFSIISNAQIHVNVNVQGGNNDGTSWANAYSDLNTALSNGSNGDVFWVAQGIYHPTSGTNQNATFNLPHDVEIYGGFSAWEININQRDWENNQTILSGNIGNINDKFDNSYNVVSILQSTTKVRLDGFTIEEGNAQGLYQKSGAGLFINAYATSTGSHPIIVNCTFQNNYSELLGGAVYVEASAGGVAYPAFDNCIFQHNESGSSGGAVYNNGYSNGYANSSFVNCSFSNNLAEGSGGAVFNHGGNGGEASPTFRQCNFDSNTATSGNGGAIYNLGSQANGNSNPFFINSRFYNNKGYAAGAIYNNGTDSGNSSPIITNCTFYANEITGSGGNGGAIYCNGSESGTSEATISNSIIWGNIAPNGSHVIRSVNGAPTFQNCIVDAVDCDGLASGVKPNITCQGGMLFNVDPLFIDAANGDLNLSLTSPAIDAGLNALNSESTDLDKNSRIFNLTIDLGAYEAQALPLPVELVFFNATLQDEQVKLSWLTDLEIENDFFTIQHSVDGSYFEDIERIESQGNGNYNQSYSSFHKNPVRGINYYRLKQTDFDGATSLSEIKTVIVQGEELSIFPNPASDYLHILFPKTTKKKYVIVINDILGKEVLRTTVEEGIELHQINLTQEGILNSGTYFIRVFDSNFNLFTQKFQKH